MMQAIDNIQAQIAQVQAEAKAKVAELEKQALAAKKAAASDAIKEVKRLIAQYGLTASDVGLSKGKSGSAKTSTGDKRAAVAPKYRDNATGQTWTGRGKPPGWLQAKLAAGATKEQFKI